VRTVTTLICSKSAEREESFSEMVFSKILSISGLTCSKFKSLAPQGQQLCHLIC